MTKNENLVINPDKKFEKRYCTGAMTGYGSDRELRLVFYDDSPDYIVKERRNRLLLEEMILSPKGAKELLLGLQRTIKRFEDSFGEIDISVSKETEEYLKDMEKNYKSKDIHYF